MSDGDAQLEIAHVLFIDVVGYSKRLVNEQTELVGRLNDLVRATEQVRQADAAGKLILIPTGDGMALAFFTSPEAPVRCAIELSKADLADPKLELRIGIHSGPVDQVTDVNKRANVAGAGINMAQRVMDCGDAGHILLSKRIADDLGQYGKWQPHLHDLGEVEVKHGVRIAVVNFVDGDLGNTAVPEKIRRLRHLQSVAGRRRTSIWSLGAITAVAVLAAAFWLQSRRAGSPHSLMVSLPEKSIAVLPFENLSSDKENAYFADGVQDDILTDLAKVADLKVISRTSVAQYRDTKKTMREIGETLGVAFVLEGSVRKAGNQIRVTAQLIDTRSDAHLWADHYDRDMADVFAIQSEISQKIVSQLQAALSPAEKAAIETQPTRDLEAYDLFLKARALLYGFGVLQKTGEENVTKAIALLEAAIARDPQFADAYCFLSEAQLSLYFSGLYDLEHLAKAREAIDTAVRISPNSGQAHLSFARLYFSALHDAPRAEEELKIAAAALPGRVGVFNLAGAIAEERGQWKEALRGRMKAVELDPRDADAISSLIELYINLRRYPEAERQIDHAIATFPAQFAGPFFRQKSFVARSKGDAKGARAELDAHPMRKSGLAGLSFEVARAAMLDRDYAEAARIIKSIPEVARAHNVLPKSGISNFTNGRFLETLGTIARAEGESEKALLAFEAARKEFEAWLAGSRDKASVYDARARACIAVIDAALGRKEDAIREGREAVEGWPLSHNAVTGPEIATQLARVYVRTGELGAALEELAKLVKLPAGPSFGELKLNPVWDDLRKDSRFEKIMAEAAIPIEI